MQFNNFKNSVLIYFWCSFLRSKISFWKLGDYFGSLYKGNKTTLFSTTDIRKNKTALWQIGSHMFREDRWDNQGVIIFQICECSVLVKTILNSDNGDKICII